MLVVFLIVATVTLAQEQPKAAEDKTVSATTQPNEQLEINREALLRGSSDQIRIKAAQLMLQDQTAAARKILLDTLDQMENEAAVTAICKAMALTRAQESSIVNPQEFLAPLIQVLTQGKEELGTLAAEASVFFGYDMLGPALEALASDPNQPATTRLNVVAALRLQPDKRAVIHLLSLVDDENERVSEQARESLRSLGMPVGGDHGDREAIALDLQRKSKDEFLRDYVMGQEKRIQQERLEVATWRQLYLESLDRLYAALTEDAQRGAFLIEHLKADQAVRRRWALAKAYEWRMAAGSNLPEAMTPVLLELVADQDRTVRLTTARLLSKMGDAGSAQTLLDRLELEPDVQVRSALFVALGMACDIALMEGAGGSVPPEVKRKTLEWAAKFLAQSEANQIREGADVIGRLLAKNGLSGEEVGRYLQLLKQRFLSADLSQNPTGKADILGTMASLCQSRSTCRAEAVKHFRDLFDDALGDSNDRIRKNAVEGLIHVDQTRALERLRKEYPNDSSAAIRHQLMEAAAKVGGEADLAWLVERLAQAQDRLVAWQAISDIAGRLDIDLLEKWLKAALAEGTPLTSDQAISLLQIAERKAVGEKKTAFRHWILRSMAAQQQKKGDPGAAAKTLVKLMEGQEGAALNAIKGDLVKLYLEGGQLDSAIKLVEAHLTQTDIEEGDPVLAGIESYLGNASQAGRKEAVAKLAGGVSVPASRPNWERCKNRWLTPPPKTEETGG
jgi:HEAT repeat protein